MAVATAVFTQSAYPKGQDSTQRRLILHGPIVISPSPATYPSGGLPITIGIANAGNVLPYPGASNFGPDTIRIDSRGGSGFEYAWIKADLWTSKYKGNVVAAGQALTDSNGNLQVCTTGGTAGSGSEPAWGVPTQAGTLGATTTDGTVVWTLTQAPSFGTVQILQQNGATGALAEIAQAASIPAGVSSDTIAMQIELLKG